VNNTKKLPATSLEQYNLTQILDAVTCPVNRHAVRAKKTCDDWELYKHPDWLIEHYVENGGAVAFARRRSEFIDKPCDCFEVCGQSDECQVSGIEHHWKHCGIRRIPCKGRANCQAAKIPEEYCI